MFIRSMMPEDFKEISWMLIQEDEGEGVLTLDPSNTFVFDDDGIAGFFMILIEQNLPSLRFFVVKREMRSLKMFRKVGKLFKDFIKNKIGFKAVIIVVKKDYLRRVVEYYFKKRPYAEDKGMSFYLVEV